MQASVAACSSKIDRTGYRVYFGKDGEALVILVGGGTREPSRQHCAGHQRWADYKQRKGRG